jgi:hypothetical protein
VLFAPRGLLGLLSGTGRRGPQVPAQPAPDRDAGDG